MANLITLARIGLIVPFAAMFFTSAPWAMPTALAIFLIAASTDFLDGYVARARSETSALGAALDPLADKLLVAAALVLLIRNGVISGAGVAAALVILLREILVSGLREAVAQRGATLSVTGLAKWKTAAQLISIGLLLAAAPGGPFGDGLRPLASGLFWVAAVLTFWTGAEYALKAVAILRGPHDATEKGVEKRP
ncbi:MAG: CDP-diacylglycerol--glycerol-3-phosphate 3-phosphatidyltransferase [Parvularculaceae bacterium]|nr:CDP-diacylglycerol--glycerol-3-phosphate 3-phosphatidyltransferase [Parvularculaceae bacterium]